MNGASEYHSVELEDETCRGCTICVTACPVEAIRVYKGKAHILEEKCIDCGQCIRICPHKAKYAKSNTLEDIGSYSRAVALVAPAWYTQFNEKYSRRSIRAALCALGFSAVCDVADAAAEITCQSAAYMRDYLENPANIRPVISSSCPAVVKLIQIRFPSLIENLLPIIPPAELAARYIRNSNAWGTEQNNGEKTGIFFLSPCPAKITVARSPLGYHQSEIDGVLTIQNTYLPVLNALKSLPPEIKTAASPVDTTDILTPLNQTWCTASGEAECLDQVLRAAGTDLKWVNASGISQIVPLLEAIEDGQLSAYDFVELSTCGGGCLGGPLTINPSPVAEAQLRRRIRSQKIQPHNQQAKEDAIALLAKSDYKALLWEKEVFPRPSQLLSPDFSKARKMMEEIENVISQLPGLDCGSCGSPNCRALAEDIVKKKAKIEDCVIILKAKYEELLFGEGHGKS
jgi:iron only hydrogenase large subunit-like protein